jgi:hypothetical protein
MDEDHIYEAAALGVNVLEEPEGLGRSQGSPSLQSLHL